MLKPALRRCLWILLCLVGAALACARAELPIVPANPGFSTPLPQPPTATPSPEATAASATETEPPTPTRAATATAAAEQTATSEPSSTPEGDIVPINNGSFDTDLSGWLYDAEVVEWQDGYARLNSESSGTGLEQTVLVPAAAVVQLHFRYRSEALAGDGCVLSVTGQPEMAAVMDTEWHAAVFDYTPLAGSEVPLILQPGDVSCGWLQVDDVYWMVPLENVAVGSGQPTPTLQPLAAIPSEATFTQAFEVSAEGDFPYGRETALNDQQTYTWASLRNGQGIWILDLGEAQTVAGMRAIFHRDGDFDTLLLGIDVSMDGTNWTPAYTGQGSCNGVAGCDVLAQKTPVDLPFGPATARYVRLRSGPSRMAITELHIALLP